MKKILIIALILASCSQKQEPQVWKGRTFINGPADTITFYSFTVADSTGWVVRREGDKIHVKDSARAIKVLLKYLEASNAESGRLRDIIHTIQVNERARPSLL